MLDRTASQRGNVRPHIVAEAADVVIEELVSGRQINLWKAVFGAFSAGDVCPVGTSLCVVVHTPTYSTGVLHG